MLLPRLDKMIRIGGYCPGEDGGISSKEETDLFVKKIWRNVRVMQGLVEVARRYHDVEFDIENDDEIVRQLRDEAVTASRSISDLVWEWSDEMYESGFTGQGTMEYFKSLGYETMKMVKANMVSDLFETGMIDTQE